MLFLKKQTPYLDLRALFLAAMMLLAFGAKEAHHVLGHSHKEVKICDVQAGETHIHDQDYISDNCQLCDFTFSIFDIFISRFDIKKIKILYASKDFNFLSFFYSRRHLFQALRAPPLVAKLFATA